MSEVELTSQPIELGDNIYESGQGSADTNQKKVLVANTIVADMANGKDIAATLEEINNSSAEQMRVKATTEYQNNQTELLTYLPIEGCLPQAQINCLKSNG